MLGFKLCKFHYPKLLFNINNSLCLVFLTACGNNNFSDLNTYILDVKAQPKVAIEALPETKPVIPFLFNPEGLRDPFVALLPIGQNELLDTSSGNNIKPDISRQKEDLEAYPLEALKMVGTLTMKSTLWGLVKADDGSVHRVQVGNYIGKNFGKITSISKDKIELMEIVPDKPGTWTEQPTSLRLFE
jgi:type IV pilus assembly protein PilP